MFYEFGIKRKYKFLMIEMAIIYYFTFELMNNIVTLNVYSSMHQHLRVATRVVMRTNWAAKTASQVVEGQ